MTGPLEKTNSAYAVAKIAGIELIKSYRKQFGHHWISLMPTNIYGPKDNFDLETSHVLPALINRFVSARRNRTDFVTLWGSGNPRREFLHSYDLAEAVLLAADKYDDDSHLNIGTGNDITIKELADIVSSNSNFQGSIKWDMSKPDGAPRKILDVTRLESLGWRARITLEEGIAKTIQWFEKNYN